MPLLGKAAVSRKAQIGSDADYRRLLAHAKSPSAGASTLHLVLLMKDILRRLG